MTTATPVTGSDTPPAGVQQNAEGATPPAQGTPAASTPPTGDEGAAKDAPGDTPEVTYEFTLPDGIAKDDAATEEFIALAKESKLPKEAAQKFVDLAVKRETARAEAFAEEVKGWEESVKADKELGGDKLPETLATCRKAIDLGPPELKALLSSTKMGSHPAVVKWAFAVGKALSEDKFVGGGTPVPASKGTANILYPNQS